MDKARTLELLGQAGLPQFVLGQDGYPLPGKVIKYYREQMKYIDRDGKEKHWTQADLARQLALTEIMVNLMENKNQGLDSIERRRTLSTILRIPPVLLGLGSLDEIVEIVTGQSNEQKSSEIKHTKITKHDIKGYQKTLRVYTALFAEGMSFTSISAVERIASKIYDIAQNTDKVYREDILRVLWDFEMLRAKIYGSDFTDWQMTFKHIDNAIDIAVLLDDKNLQAISLYNSGLYHLRQGKIGLAKVDIDGALLYSKGAFPQVKGVIYTLSSWYHQKTGDLFISQKMYEEAEKYVGMKSERAPIKFGKGTYLIGKGELLIHMNRPVKALEYLDDAERHISSSQRRLYMYLDIVRARCFIEMKRPEYEQTTNILRAVIADNRQMVVARNMNHIKKLYQKLANSSYGNSPEVSELGIELKDLQPKS